MDAVDVDLGELELDFFAEDLFADDGGFRPGLRPRPHLASSDLLAASAGEPEETLTRGDDPDEVTEQLEELRADFLSPAREAPATEEAAPAVDIPTDTRRSDPRVPADVRRSIESFEPRNLYQRQLRSLAIRMMLHIERDCPPPGVTPLDNSRDFHAWWRIFHIYRWILLSPTMATRRARTVLDELLELSDDELTVYRLNRLGDRKLTPEMRNLVKSENHGDLVSPDVSNHQGRPSCEERP